MKSIRYCMGLMLGLLALAGCKKDFLDKPPTDRLTDATYFNTDEQVLAGTSLLYNLVWYEYNDKASFGLGDFRGGTTKSSYSYQDNVTFNVTPQTPENSAAWRAFFNVVGQSNTVIQNIKKYAKPAVSEGIKQHAFAEARFMRATAYRFLVMNWGPVPIIENNLEHLNDTSMTRNTVESVWKFITRDYIYAASILPETPILPGRVTKWSAEAMLARTYLTRAGVGASPGARNQVYLDSAKYYADRVIQMSGARLLSDYAELFKYPYDNNAESLFELQWIYSAVNSDNGVSNSAPAYLGYSSDIANGDGWGGDVGATWWMLNQYDGLVKNGNTLDQRLKPTYMLPGMTYPEISQTVKDDQGNVVLQELVYPFVGTDESSSNNAAVKKYIVGKAVDVGGKAMQQRYDHDTYMIRLAEMYLTYAEASLGNQASTTDPKALEYFNAVHMRAGLPKFEGPLTFDDIFKERIVEFAMEGMAWYDLVRLHYYDPEKAYKIVDNQDRGLFWVKPDRFPNPTKWEFYKTAWATTNRTYSADAGNFLLPIPAAELSQAPNLRKPPVEYDFGG